MKFVFLALTLTCCGFLLGRLSRKSVHSELSTPTAAETAATLVQVHRSEPNDQDSVAWLPFTIHRRKSFVEHLRAIGCPEGEIPTIVIGEMNRFFAQKLEREYAQQQPFSPTSARNSLLKIKKERRHAIAETLGSDSSKEDALWKVFYSDDIDETAFLPSELQASIDKVRELKRDREASVADRSKGFQTSEDRDELKIIEEDYARAISSLLPPDVRKRLDLLRYTESQQGKDLELLFEPSPIELEALQSFSTGEITRDELRFKLGEQRFSEFSNLQDPQYREVSALARRFSLEPTVADGLLKLRESFLREQFNLIRSSPNEADKNFSSVSRRLSELLGADAATAYLKDGKHATWTK